MSLPVSCMMEVAWAQGLFRVQVACVLLGVRAGGWDSAGQGKPAAVRRRGAGLFLCARSRLACPSFLALRQEAAVGREGLCWRKGATSRQGSSLSLPWGVTQASPASFSISGLFCSNAAITERLGLQREEPRGGPHLRPAVQAHDLL